jgi:hypothetical protein
MSELPDESEAQLLAGYVSGLVWTIRKGERIADPEMAAAMLSMVALRLGRDGGCEDKVRSLLAGEREGLS